MFFNTSWTRRSALWLTCLWMAPAIAVAATPLSSPNLTYEVREGGVQSFDLYYPDNYGSQPNPLYIHFHEGGGDKSGHATLWPRLAAAGFIVASVNYRDSIDNTYEVAFDDARSFTYFVFNYILTSNEIRIDPSRISIGGFSYGGLMASVEATAAQTFVRPGSQGRGWLLPFFGTPYKCLVNGVGPWDLQHALQQPHPLYDWIKGVVSGRFGASPPAYLSPGSPANLANLRTRNVYLLSSLQDTAVPHTAVTLMAAGVSGGRLRFFRPDVGVVTYFPDNLQYLPPNWAHVIDHYLTVNPVTTEAAYGHFVSTLNSVCR